MDKSWEIRAGATIHAADADKVSKRGLIGL